MSPISWTPSSLFFSLTVVLAGCSSEPKYGDMTEKERAARITDLRKDSERELSLYLQSQDIASLERHAELEHESTKVNPTTCGMCFFRYGAALSRMGLHYKTLAAAFARDAREKELSPQEKAEYEAKSRKYDDVARSYFEKSNQQIEIYLASGEPVIPDAYQWLSQQYEELKDYRNALRYLDLLAVSVPLTPEDKKNVEALRKKYEELRRRQEEQEFEREIERAPPPRNARGGTRAEPAN